MKDFTNITIVLDRSGSMSSMVKDVIGGYKTFIEKQKELGDNASVTLVQFDDQYEVVFHDMPIKYVSSSLDFQPRGSTALLDAMGKAINSVGASLRAKPEWERPDKVIFVVITDGEENASSEFKIEKIREMVTRQQNTYNWQFIFMGANIDSFATGTSLGISSYTISNFQNNAKGMAANWTAVGSYTSCLRTAGFSGQSMAACYDAAEKDEEAKLGANTQFLVGSTTGTLNSGQVGVNP